ncbi:MAG: ATP phosphoribosyltransferase regulatory subunit [Clostridiales bacterium]|nr:ATP phosphoribosyltransferase regulatory subunit [Clostridiales bacterium]
MIINDSVISGGEKIIFALREIYFKNGFRPYRMSKFEEYDLYAKNKDFLVSDNVITFTDTSGKLMALKPDVTLSIIKNIKDSPDEISRLYYNENVYRISKGTNTFKEIMQSGLECIGKVDGECIAGVVSTAVQSLQAISGKFILDVSDLDIVSALIDRAGDLKGVKNRLISLFGEKNAHEAARICRENGAGEEYIKAIKELISLYGKPEKIMPELRRILSGVGLGGEFALFENIIKSFDKAGIADEVNIDFSVVSDMNYYNGVVFKGFVDGAADSVLSGGQYDNLMKKMKKKSKAIGFAVYTDRLPVD